MSKLICTFFKKEINLQINKKEIDESSEMSRINSAEVGGKWITSQTAGKNTNCLSSFVEQFGNSSLY